MQKLLGPCETENGTKIDEVLQVGAKGKMLKRIQILEDGSVFAKEARNWKIEGQKRRTTRKEYRRLSNECERGGFMAQKMSVEFRQRECGKTEVH